MALAPGTRLGVYEIGASLGAGGMGEVYRARDTKLHRDVAIKVLPEALAHDIERLARFEREARTLASLNHPNIAQIHGLEESDGIKALVMELVEGPTLADRIVKGPIPLDEALPIAKQIAEALEAAHEQGIVHRDLKPANVKVRPDGVVKVLDFGLAKLVGPPEGGRYVGVGSVRLQPDLSQSPTITTPAMTQLGVILGTAAYMSPEQAKGRGADKRSDVWAFGCVLYEMVTGKRAFEGEDVSDTLAAVLRGQPDWTALPANVSPSIVTLLRGSLEKDQRRRIGDLSTARFIIDREGDALAAVATPPVSKIKRAASILAALATTAAIAAYTTFTMTRVSPPSLPLAQFTIALPTGDRFSNTGVHAVALSADGTRLVYTANQRLYLRMMDQLEATPIRGTEVAVAEGRGSTESVLFTRWSVDRLLAGWSTQEGLGRRRRGAAAVSGGNPIGCHLDEQQHDSLRAERGGRRREGQCWDLARLERRRKAGAFRETRRQSDRRRSAAAARWARHPVHAAGRPRRVGYGADRRSVTRQRQAPRRGGARRRRAVCADRSPRIRA